MEHGYILSILYEMALVIGGEVSVKPLLTRMLQRLLYHTSFPAGFVCLDVPTAAAESAGMLAVRIDAAVGDYELAGLIGQTVPLPARLLRGAAERGEDAALIEAALAYHGGSFDPSRWTSSLLSNVAPLRLCCSCCCVPAGVCCLSGEGFCPPRTLSVSGSTPVRGRVCRPR